MDNPFNPKVGSSVNGVYSDGLTVNQQSVEETHTQQHVMEDDTTVEGLGNESQPVMMIHQEQRVVFPTMITNDMVHTQTDESSVQQINPSIDPYGNHIPMIMTFPDGDIGTDLLIKGSSQMDTLTTREKFSNTLVGCITNMIRENKCPMSSDEIVTRVTPIVSDLRKMDGTKYKGNVIKAVNGALSSTGIFSRLENGKWIVREEELRSYEQRTHKKIESKGKKKRYTAVQEEEKPPKRKYAKRKDRKQAIVQILDSISTSLSTENAERSDIYFHNPFSECSCIENYASLQRTLGPERFKLCIQLYSYFEDLFKVATGDVKYDLQHVVNTGNLMNDKRIIQLWVEIEEIKQRMRNIEKMLKPSIELFFVCLTYLVIGCLFQAGKNWIPA